MSFTSVVDKQYPGGDIPSFSGNNRESYNYTGRLLTGTDIKIGKGKCVGTSGYNKGNTLDIFFSASGSGAPSDGRAVFTNINNYNKYEFIYRGGKYAGGNTITNKPEVSSSIIYHYICLIQLLLLCVDDDMS